MAAIRLDDEADNIEKTLAVALLDNKSGAVTNKSITTDDPLASSTWEEVTMNCLNSLSLLQASYGVDFVKLLQGDDFYLVKENG